MTPDPHTPSPSSTTIPEAALDTARLQLDESTPRHGDVDGGWWPRSRALATELPGLVTALRPRLGPIAVLAYHVDDWDTAPATIVVDGHTIRTDSVGDTPQGPQAVAVVATDGQCVTLVLIAPSQPQAAAHGPQPIPDPLFDHRTTHRGAGAIAKSRCREHCRTAPHCAERGHAHWSRSLTVFRADGRRAPVLLQYQCTRRE